MPPLLAIAGYAWAAPNTLLGLVGGVFGRPWGTQVQVVDGVVEFYGGPLAWVLARAPIAGGAMALTLGHVVWGRSAAALDRSRRHERVHVAQYAMWGPCFLPAYALASGWAWLRGACPYRDNAFERAAFACEL